MNGHRQSKMHTQINLVYFIGLVLLPNTLGFGILWVLVFAQELVESRLRTFAVRAVGLGEHGDAPRVLDILNDRGSCCFHGGS